MFDTPVLFELFRDEAYTARNPYIVAILEWLASEIAECVTNEFPGSQLRVEQMKHGTTEFVSILVRTNFEVDYERLESTCWAEAKRVLAKKTAGDLAKHLMHCG